MSIHSSSQSSVRSLWRRAGAALLGAALVATVNVASQPAAAAPYNGPGAEPGSTAGPMNAAFARAAKQFGVPRDLLVAVGYGETHLDGHDGEPSQANGYGVMHLASNPQRHALERAARLTGESVADLKQDTAANIRGGAALLRAHADDLGLTAAERHRLAAWYPAVARYGGATSKPVARIYADTVYELLNLGISTRVAEGERVTTPRREVTPRRGSHQDVGPIGASTASGKPKASQPKSSQTEGDVGAQSPDYPPARWVPAYSGNYSAGRSSSITHVVIHVTQGSYAGTISWFQNPSSNVSAHYVIRSSDGEVTQMVRDHDTAWHVRSYNPNSLGIEHEGFVDDPGWFTDAMYRSSAALTRRLCDRHGIPKDRSHIIGHNEAPNNDHTDPGPNWNWNYYMQLVGSGGKGVYGGSPTDFNGDGSDDIVAFTHGSLADVYVASSTGHAFGGSAKWHEMFAPSGETPLTGDFNGDGSDDIVTFTHGANADVYVALSNGSSFGAGQKWHDWFALSGEVPAVGDFNGDGKDDIATFTNNADGFVYVALSTGSSFGASVKWHDWFAPNGEFPAVGDVNGDGKDDIVTFTRGSLGDVYIALSTGSGFGASVKWHDWFAIGAEQPRVGDFDGDGKADVATFNRGSLGDVYVALSTGSGFSGTEDKWHDWFAPHSEFPYVGDFNGDGRDDIVTFTKNSDADVYTALSSGSTFGAGAKWHDFFGLAGETTL